VQTLFEEGIIREDEMRSHPKKNLVTSSVSGDGLSGSMKLFTTKVHLRNNDIFFICSDGIWGCFSHTELEKIYLKFQGFEFCEKILTLAISKKAPDNISAILVHIVLLK
jgi:serine/threonine protein phosphatase PrpC